MLNTIEIQYYRSADVNSVLLFYSKTSYKSANSTLAEDEIVAACNGNEVIVLYRLCHEEDVCVLRGFYVLEEYRGKGIGNRMLQMLDKVTADKDIYLICTRPRNNFYAKAGFNVTLNNVPAILQERLRNYNNPEMNILLRLAENVH